MGVFTADHVIRPVERFGAALERAFAAAEAHGDALITFGIRPSEPHTGYGYLQRGAAQGEGVWSVEQFKEKPDLATAQRYLSSGVHFWNSGMFVWRTPTILDLLARLVPRAHEMGAKLGGIWGTEAGRQWARSVYPTLDRVSIDVAVMEKAPRVLMVEMDASWMDVGSWTALASVIGADAGGNTVSGARFVQVDSTNNVVVAEDGHTVAAIGVNDLVVVHSADATLVCRKDEAQRIKQLMDQVGSDLQ
jgi:mannose-1-phosphate guanylyltransferase